MFEPENYTIRRYLILCFGNTMPVNIMNWIYTRTAGADFLPHYGFLPFTLFTFSVGVFPVVFLTLVIDKTILKIKTRNAIMMQVIKPEINDQEQKPEEFIIRNSAGATHLHFSGQDFICARSNENYTQIYYRENNSVRKELVRIPIARFYEQVKEGAHIVRCHRSGVVNLKYIKHITGKSRSLELSLDHVDEPVPVSRDFPRSLLYSPLRSR